MSATTTNPPKARLLTRAEIVKLASREVDKFFDQLASNMFLLTEPGDLLTEDLKLEDAFEAISHHIEAADVAKCGELTPDQDLRFWSLGREAGYIIGVQVGLRLRNLREAR